jgi:hypothetical protein
MAEHRRHDVRHFAAYATLTSERALRCSIDLEMTLNDQGATTGLSAN